MVRVTIYSKPDCHLCDIAKERVGNVRREVAFEVEEVDIASDPVLYERYGKRIPVVAVDGEEVCVYRVSERLLKRRVQEAVHRERRLDMEEGSQAQEQPRSGIAGRIFGTFFSPGTTFESVRASSSWADWVVPLILSAIVSLGVAWKVAPIEMHEKFEEQREGIQQNSSLTEDQKKEALARIDMVESKAGSFVGPMMFIFTPLASLIMLAILSGIYLGIANFLFGGTGTFIKMMAVTAYSSMVGTLGGLIKLPLIVMKNTAMVAMGPALFFPPDMEHTWAYRLASGIDIFWIWNFTVASIGVGVVSGVPPKKVGAVVFAIYLAIIIGWAFFKSMFGG